MLELCHERTQLLKVQKQDVSLRLGILSRAYNTRTLPECICVQALTLTEAFAAWRSGNSTPFQASLAHCIPYTAEATCLQTCFCHSTRMHYCSVEQISKCGVDVDCLAMLPLIRGD